MKIKKIVVGQLEENCYILTKDNKTIIIDPGDEFDKIDEQIEGKLIGILITHYHFDHIGALEELQENYNVPIIDYKNKMLLEPFNYEILETPGHTSDSISIIFKEKNMIFCGDFIFKGAIGRTDLPTGNREEMKKSIKNILTFNKDIILYPGHYESTTIEKEKENLEYILKYY